MTRDGGVTEKHKGKPLVQQLTVDRFNLKVVVVHIRLVYVLRRHTLVTVVWFVNDKIKVARDRHHQTFKRAVLQREDVSLVVEQVVFQPFGQPPDVSLVLCVKEDVDVGELEGFVWEALRFVHVELPLGAGRGVQSEALDVPQDVPDARPLVGVHDHVDVVVPGDEGVVAQDAHQWRLQDEVRDVRLLAGAVEGGEGEQQLGFLCRRHDGLEGVQHVQTFLQSGVCGVRRVLEFVEVLPELWVGVQLSLHVVVVLAEVCLGAWDMGDGEFWTYGGLLLVMTIYTLSGNGHLHIY